MILNAKVELAGKTYDIRLSHNVICDAEQELGVPMLFGNQMSMLESARALRAILWSALKRTEKDPPTVEQVGDMIDETEGGSGAILASIIRAWTDAMPTNEQIEELIGEEAAAEQQDPQPQEP